MMKKWVFWVLMSAAFAVFGDARIQHNCHFPYSNDNVNLESKVDCQSSVRDVNGNLFGFAELRKTLEDGSVVDAPLRPEPGTYSLETLTSGAESGAACAIVDCDDTADGRACTEYATNDWEVSHLVRETAYGYRYDVTYRITCRGANAIQ